MQNQNEAQTNQAIHAIERAKEPQPLTSDELSGISKKYTRELDALPLHSHGAVLKMMQVAYEHRNITMQREEALRQQRLQEMHIENQRREIEFRQKQWEAEQAEKLREQIAAQPTQ